VDANGVIGLATSPVSSSFTSSILRLLLLLGTQQQPGAEPAGCCGVQKW